MICERLLAVLLLVSLLASSLGASPEIETLPSSELLKRAITLSNDLQVINTRLSEDLKAAQSESEALRMDLEKVQNEVEILKQDLEKAWNEAQISEAELKAVSSWLMKAESDLQSLTRSYESLKDEAQRETTRANKAERRIKFWKYIAGISAVFGISGWAVYAIREVNER
jgi:chromosome segregation ATPase